MNNYKTLAFLFLFFILQISVVKSQNIKFSIQSGTSFLKIPDIQNDITDRAPLGMADLTSLGNVLVREQFKEKSGYNVNGNLDFKLNKNLFFRSGLGLSLFRFSKKIILELPDDQNNNQTYELNYYIENSGKILQYGAFNEQLFHRFLEFNDTPISPEDIGRTSTLYVNIPFKFVFSILNDKLKLNTGLTISLLAYSEQCYESIDSNSTFQSNIRGNIDKSSDRFNNTLCAFETEVSYQFFRHFLIYAKYSKNLSPIYDKQYQFAGIAKYQFLETGIGYAFGN